MKKLIICMIMLVCTMILLTGCSPVKHSFITLYKEKKAVQEYLKETYPNQKFNVSVTSDHGTSMAGDIPCTGWYLHRTATDENGVEFEIRRVGNENENYEIEYEYHDNYEEVLEELAEQEEENEDDNSEEED